MKALHQTIDYFCSMKDMNYQNFFVVTGDLSEGEQGKDMSHERGT